MASKLAKLAAGVCSYFSIPIIKATLFLLDLDLIIEGLSSSSFSTNSVSSISIVILTSLGFDLLPHWSIATIFICSSTGLNLLILNLPFLTGIVLPSISTNSFLELSITFPSIS